jgi:glyoxylase-like metal-dependent hydrolase (beta-lactamase superfamily II)
MCSALTAHVMVCMLLRASSLIYPHLYLLTLGDSCRYLLAPRADALTITDPGSLRHVAVLPQRMSLMGLDVAHIRRVVLTHLDADRASGLPLLRRLAPYLQFYATRQMYELLAREEFVTSLWNRWQDELSSGQISSELPTLSFEEYREYIQPDRPIGDSDEIDLEGDAMMLRVFLTPGHTAHSTAYLALPHGFLICDETFGYFQGQRLAAPGGDHSLSDTLTSIARFQDLELCGIGLPYVGALTGELAAKHLKQIRQNTADLITESHRAMAEGVPRDRIEEFISEAFYLTSSKDKALHHALARSKESVIRQVLSGS